MKLFAEEKTGHWGSKPLVRLLLIAGLVLLLQVPILLIESVIREREYTRIAAVDEVTGKWGQGQTIMGPVMTIPYTHRFKTEDKNGKDVWREQVKLAAFLPETLDLAGTVNGDHRKRGIYDIPVYTSSLSITGRFVRPDFTGLGIAETEVHWDRASLVMLISEVRAVKNQAVLSWNSHPVSFVPGIGRMAEGRTECIPAGIHADLSGKLDGTGFNFSIPLDIQGSQSLRFAPFGKITTAGLKGDWTAPSFQGNWLPNGHKLDGLGFSAQWSIPYLGRNYPQAWPDAWLWEKEIQKSIFGVDMLSPVDAYRMSIRSVKYEVLFLALTFVVLWLFEIRSGLKVHPIQYLFVGAGMCLFYLLHLSLAEHIGFGPAYILAAGAVTGLISVYAMTMLKTGSRALIMSAMLVALYSCLYVLLQEEDYALLIGSVGLFGVLAMLMFATRKIDWFHMSPASKQTPSSDASASPDTPVKDFELCE